MESSFRLFRVRGIDIGANWSWLFVFALIIYALSTNLFPSAYEGLGQSTYWAMGVVAGVLFVISLLLHELGHAFRAQKEGMEIEGITLWLFGGVARFKGMFPSAGAEFRIAIAGPAVTVVIGIMFWALWRLLALVDAPLPLQGITAYLTQINGVLFAFNMIPALPLDGGRVLRSFFWYRSGNFASATSTAARLARMIAGGLIALGLLFLLTPNAPFEGLWLAFIGWFLLQAARSEENYALFRQTLGGLRVGELMTPDPESVDPELTIASFIDDVAHVRGHSTYPVVDGFGNLVGLVGLRQAAQVPVGERGTTRVRNVMVPREALSVVGPDTQVTQAMTDLQSGAGRAVVMDGSNVAGILSMSDVANAIELEQIRAPSTGRSRRGKWVLLAVVSIIAVAMLYAPPYVIFGPGAAFDVTPDIKITGVDTDKVSGEWVLTSVVVEQPKLIGLFAAIAQGREIAPLSAVVGGSDPEQYFKQQAKLFKETQTTAAAAAAKAAGLPVKIEGTGALVTAVANDSPAADVLKRNDVIRAVDGQPVTLADQVVKKIRSRPSGASFTLEVERGKSRRSVRIRTKAGIVPGAPGIGALLQTRDFKVDLPFKIEFKAREIGGPSAGITYALAVYDLIEKSDLARGRAIATTGTMDLEGQVGPVGGLDQKAIAGKRHHSDLFLVPEEEVDDARGAGIDVIGVGSLAEAIDVLRAKA